MKEKIYNKLIPILILLQPLFDVFTSLMTRNGFGITIGIIIKIILIVLFIIYLVFLDKNKRKNNIIFMIILGVFSVVNIIINFDIVSLNFIYYFNYMFKYIYLIITLIYFIRWFKNGNNIKLYQLRVPMIIICLVFLLSFITKTSFYSYDMYRRGITGWFNSANEIGALICLLFPISLFNAFHSSERKKIDLVLFFCIGFIAIFIGTKTGFLGYLLTLICYIIYRLITIKKQRLDYKFFICIFVLILPFIFWNEIPAIYNTKLKIENNNIGEVNIENVNSIVLSGRDDFIDDMLKRRKNISVIEFLFGKSFLKSDNSILIVEQDILDIYYMYGLIGIVIFFSIFVYLLLKIFKEYIYNIRKTIYIPKIFCCILAIVLTFFVSLISGHVLLSPSVSTYFCLVLVILYSKFIVYPAKEKKNMIIYMPKLSIGGMEQALINLLNMSNLKEKYNIDLYLGYCVEDKYLDCLPKNINVLLICKGKWNLFNKIITAIKMGLSYLNLVINPYKYDISICYAYQHGILSKLTRLSSKNNIIFIHNDLLKCRTQEDLKKLKRKVKFDKFSKIICVGNRVKKSFEEIYPNYKGDIRVINNYIDGEKILRLSKEKIKDMKKSKKVTFINIGRHEEKAKKITRIINSAKKLYDEGYVFRVILIGDGEDHKQYIDLIKENNLEKNILLLGKKVNPYPYLKLSDCFILSSEYEGYGIVIDESRILDVPIISTDVADAKQIMKDGYGILCENSTDGIYVGMKKYLDNEYKIKSKFDYKKFNKKITDQIDEFVI